MYSQQYALCSHFNSFASRAVFLLIIAHSIIESVDSISRDGTDTPHYM